jgi:hypothetical protein
MPRPIVPAKTQDDTMLEWVKRGRLPAIRPSYKRAVVARATDQDPKTVYRWCQRGWYATNAAGEILYGSLRDKIAGKESA